MFSCCIQFRQMIKNTIAMYSVMRDHKKSQAELKPIVNKRLRDLLISAYENVPHYHAVMNSMDYNPKYDFTGSDDLKSFPILTREDIHCRNSEKFLSKRVDKSALCSDQSSGSSGFPIVVWREKRARAFQIASWLRVFFLNGYKLFDKTMSFSVPSRMKEGRTIWQNAGILRRKPLYYLLPPEQLLDRILEYRPDVLYGNRSNFDVLTRELKRRSIRIDFLKLALAGGEIINERIRETCKEYLGVQLTEYYGMVETGNLGFETPERDGLHLNEDLIHYEFLNSDGTSLEEGDIGDLVVTRYIDRAMPLIRYHVGDKISIMNVKSDNGEVYRRIKSVNGRDNQTIRLPDGSLLEEYHIGRLLYRQEELHQFRIIQEGQDFFRILLVGDKNYCEQIKSAIKVDLDQLLSPLSDYVIERVPEIPIDRTGKFRTLITYDEIMTTRT